MTNKELLDTLILVSSYLATLHFCVLIGREFGSFEKFGMAMIDIIKEVQRMRMRRSRDENIEETTS